MKCMGKRQAFFPANNFIKPSLGFSTKYEIMRGDLCRIVYGLSKSRAKYIFGTSIESYEENDKEKTINVRFANATEDTFDLVIGADGQGPRTRKMMLGREAPDAFRPLNGRCIGYFTFPQPIKEGEGYVATMYSAPGGRGIMLRRRNAQEIQAYLGGQTNSEKLKEHLRGDVAEQKEALKVILQGAGWRADEILGYLKDSKNFYCERLGLVKMPHWSRGRVTLVGDAAYCPSVMTGMGTTSGIVGAYVLAGEIGRHCGGPSEEGNDSLMAAVQAYEQTFRPVINQVQAGVAEDEGLWHCTWKLSYGSCFPFEIGCSQQVLYGSCQKLETSDIQRVAPRLDNTNCATVQLCSLGTISLISTCIFPLNGMVICFICSTSDHGFSLHISESIASKLIISGSKSAC